MRFLPDGLRAAIVSQNASPSSDYGKTDRACVKSRDENFFVSMGAIR